MSDFDDVGDFHEKFGLPNVTHRGDGVREVPDELLKFRIGFLEEELDEFKTAAAEGDLARMFDALIDLVYVAHGTAHIYGFPWHAGWAAVHRANMRKVRAKTDGSDSVRGSAYDVVKPADWASPDLNEVLFTTPTQCPQCRRYLKHVTLREVIVDRGGTQWVTVHCLCGRQLLTRPA